MNAPPGQFLDWHVFVRQGLLILIHTLGPKHTWEGHRRRTPKPMRPRGPGAVAPAITTPVELSRARSRSLPPAADSQCSALTHQGGMHSSESRYVESC